MDDVHCTCTWTCHNGNRVSMNYSSGNALLTVATGKLSEAESDRAGLVTTHAYAVLNLRENKVLTTCTCMCKFDLVLCHWGLVSTVRSECLSMSTPPSTCMCKLCGSL